MAEYNIIALLIFSVVCTASLGLCAFCVWKFAEVSRESMVFLTSRDAEQAEKAIAQRKQYEVQVQMMQDAVREPALEDPVEIKQDSIVHDKDGIPYKIDELEIY